MNQFTTLKMAVNYWRARVEILRREETGAGAPEYLFIMIGVIAIAGLAIVAVRTYVTNKGNELNGGE